MNKSMKPYLIRAVYQWCVDSGLTPYLVARVGEHTRVPEGYAKDGEITLNVSHNATHNLEMGDDTIRFDTRFNAKSWACWIPVPTVVGLYAKENGVGMQFPYEEPKETTPVNDEPTPPPRPSRGKPQLKLVR